MLLVAAVRIWKEERERSMERGLRMVVLLVFFLPIRKKKREEMRSCKSLLHAHQEIRDPPQETMDWRMKFPKEICC